MSDRALRDELERLQVEVKGLEAELAVEHAPAFLERREALRASVKQVEAIVSEKEREASTADARLTELQRRVESLASQLRAVEQDRLSAPSLLLVFVPPAFLGLAFASTQLQFQLVGVAGAGVFGLLFGPRLGAWARGNRELVARPTRIPSSPQRPALFSAIFAGLFAAVAILGALVQLNKLWGEFTSPTFDPPVFVDTSHFWSVMWLQFAALVALLLSARVHRLSRDVNAEAARSALVIANLMTFVLGVGVLSWIPIIQSTTRWLPQEYETHGLAVSLVASFAPLIPAALLLTMLWRPRVARRWPVVASLACAVAAASVSLWSAHQPRAPYFLDSYSFEEGWTVVQLALLGAALAQGRWLGLLACLGAVGLTGLRFFGVF